MCCWLAMSCRGAVGDQWNSKIGVESPKAAQQHVDMLELWNEKRYISGLEGMPLDSRCQHLAQQLSSFLAQPLANLSVKISACISPKSANVERVLDSYGVGLQKLTDKDKTAPRGAIIFILSFTTFVFIIAPLDSTAEQQ